MNQEMIAKKLGVTQGLISQIINGHVGVSKKLAVRFTQEFGKDPEFWIFARPEKIIEALRGEVLPGR